MLFLITFYIWTQSISLFYSSTATCRNVKCSTGMYCLQDQYLSPHCVNCTWKCPTRGVGDSANFGSASANVRRHQVCGVDGRTYRNVCEIRRAACRQGRAIPVAYRGPCNNYQGESCISARCIFVWKVNPTFLVNYDCIIVDQQMIHQRLWMVLKNLWFIFRLYDHWTEIACDYWDYDLFARPQQF